MTKFLKRWLIFIMTSALSFMLCSCKEIKLASSLDDDTLIKIENETIASAEGIFRLAELVMAYGDIDDTFFSRSVGDITMDEYLKESVKEEMTMLLCADFMADDLAVYLTDEEIEAADDAGALAYEEILALYDLSAYGVTQSSAQSLYERQALYEKLYSYLTDSVTMQISETDTKVIEVNFVLFPEGMTIDEAESFRDVLLSGGDFESVCTDAGYEPYMNITVKKGDMTAAFENAAFALGDGELSECIETVDGIYLIECVNDYLEAESAANYNSVITSARDEIFSAAYTEFYESVEIRFNSDFWDGISAADF